MGSRRSLNIRTVFTSRLWMFFLLIFTVVLITSAFIVATRWQTRAILIVATFALASETSTEPVRERLSAS